VKRRGAAPPSESERGWGPASSKKSGQFFDYGTIRNAEIAFRWPAAVLTVVSIA
jgi:hypothetical protein